jgi:hypothetical protein
MYAFLGRLLHPLQELDNWQVIFFIKGVAQSGKSTIGNVAKWFYKPEDVAVLSSNIEAKFGLDAIADKLLFICFEVTRSWNLPRSEFQSIICAEAVSIAGKHKTARTIDRWEVPGLLIGNELANWFDSGGSIARRLVVAEMRYKVSKVDTELDKKLRQELPALIYKSKLAYELVRRQCGTRSIWELLPRFFTDIQAKIAIATNPITQFLNDVDKVVLREDLETARLTFEQELREYINTQTKHIAVSPQDIESKLTELGIDMVIKVGVIDGRRHQGVYLKGIGLKSQMRPDQLDEQKEEQLVNHRGDEDFDEKQNAEDVATELWLSYSPIFSVALPKQKLCRRRREEPVIIQCECDR